MQIPCTHRREHIDEKRREKHHMHEWKGVCSPLRTSPIVCSPSEAMAGFCWCFCSQNDTVHCVSWAHHSSTLRHIQIVVCCFEAVCAARAKDAFTIFDPRYALVNPSTVAVAGRFHCERCTAVHSGGGIKALFVKATGFVSKSASMLQLAKTPSVCHTNTSPHVGQHVGTPTVKLLADKELN